MKEQFIKLYNENIHRKGADELLKWLQSSDFFTAPASTKYHSNHDGGLCERSVNVFNRLQFALGTDYIADPFDFQYEYPGTETATIVSLLHDVCKVNFYKPDTKNVKNAAGVWEKVPYYSVDEKFPFGHGEKSVFLIERFMRLTTEEAVAIRFHMGEFQSLRCTSSAYSKYPLAVMLHIADLQATYLDEKE